MAKDLEKALVNNPEAKLGGAEKPHMDLGAHLEYIESLLERGGGSSGGSGGGSGGGSVNLLKPIITEGKTPVPNTGYLDKVFFNTKLTTNEVDALIANANLPFIDAGVPLYPILGTEAGVVFVIVIIDLSSVVGEAGSSWAISDVRENGLIYYTSPAAVSITGADAGWNKSAFTSFETGELIINSDLVSDINGIAIGSNNELLTNLVYSPGLADNGETEVVKSLTGQYKIVETNLKLDTKVSNTYTYDFINNINEDTKEINVISNIEVNTQEKDIIEKTLTTYTNNDVTKVESEVFYNCKFLTDINLPNTVKISSSAFSKCIKLVNVNIPNVQEIDTFAFSNCEKLTNVSFPKAKKVGTNAFSGCHELVHIDIPLVTIINDYTFQYCNKLVYIDLSSVSLIKTGAFAECGSLISITLPEVISLYSSAFQDTFKLTEVYTPKLTYIDNTAFFSCYSLVKIFISQKDQICNLAYGGFRDCYHLDGVQHSTYNPQGLKDGYIYVPASLLSQYKVARNWTDYASQIIGHEELEAGSTLPDYTTSSFTKQTWYSDEKLTTVVTSVATTGRYYCRLEA